MTTIAQDTFTEAVSDTHLSAHTPNIGTGWTVQVANVLTVRAATDILIYTGTNNSRGARQNQSVVVDDMDVYADATLNTSAGNTEVGIRGRMDFTSATPALLQNWYIAQMNASGVILQLGKNVSGTLSLLGSFTPTGSVTGQTYNIRLSIRTASKQAYLSGISVISSTDDATGLRGNTRAGLSIRIFSSSPSMDNWSVDDFISAGAAVGGIMTPRTSYWGDI